MRLILIRHAKSSWANPGQGDHARPLNPRGRRAATAIGGWLADKGYVPDLILCSDAQRTRETTAGTAGSSWAESSNENAARGRNASGDVANDLAASRSGSRRAFAALPCW